MYVPHAVGHLVLVEVLPVERVTKAGIIIAETLGEEQDKRQSVGRILDVGPTAYGEEGGAEKWGVKAGDLVLFARQGGTTPTYPGANSLHRVLNDSDIILRLEETED